MSWLEKQLNCVVKMLSVQKYSNIYLHSPKAAKHTGWPCVHHGGLCVNFYLSNILYYP